MRNFELHPKELDFEKIIILLNEFSQNLMPFGRAIFTSQELVSSEFTNLGIEETYKIDYQELSYEKPKRFAKYFQEDYLCVFTELELEQKLTDYFNWKFEESKQIINFLTTDLNSDRHFKIDFLNRPLIKIGENYFWLSSLLKKRDWAILMHNRIVNEGNNLTIKYLNEKNKQKTGKYDAIQIPKLEEKIAQEFINAGVNAKASFKLYDKSGKEITDIDTIAYKEKILFVIQAKCHYPTEDLISNEKNHLRKIQSDAFSQALISKFTILEELFAEKEDDKSNLNRIKSELGIDCPNNEIIIIPIIVNNNFYGDGFIDKGLDKQLAFLKMSIFELTVILRNSLKDMFKINENFAKIFFGLHNNTSFTNEFSSYLDFEKQENLFSSTINGEKFELKNYSLWKNPEKFEIEDFMDIIKDDKVWDVVRKTYRNQFNNIKIGTYNPDEKYLE